MIRTECSLKLKPDWVSLASWTELYLEEFRGNAQRVLMIDYAEGGKTFEIVPGYKPQRLLFCNVSNMNLPFYYLDLGEEMRVFLAHGQAMYVDTYYDSIHDVIRITVNVM